MSTGYEDVRALVVGGTHGVGLAIAERLTRRGARVLVTGSREENAKAAGEALGPRGEAVVSDVKDAARRTELAGLVRDRLGTVNALFLNVGVAELGPVEAVTEEAWDRQFDVNAKGSFFTAQALLPLVEPGGGIVFTTVTASTATRGMGVYLATKAAVRAYAGTMAAELVGRGIRVNTVAPGFIDTPTLGVASLTPQERAELHATGDAITPMKRHGRPDEVARAAIFLALEATFSTGTELQVDGGLSSIEAA